jgi:uncharacterized delta-60 repeat protein
MMNRVREGLNSLVVACGASLAFGLAASALAFDGELDLGFDGPSGGANGKFSISLGPGPDYAAAVVIQPDGKIVVAGQVDSDPGVSVENDFAVARFNPNGALDQGFDGDSGTGNGVVVTDVSPAGQDSAYGVTIDPDGNILVVGGADGDPGPINNSDVALVRYLGASGQLDTSFDGDGIRIKDLSSATNGFDALYSVAIQPGDEKIIAAGEADMTGTGDDVLVARFNPSDGGLDDSFDGDSGLGDGVVTVDFAGLTDYAVRLRLQTDGKIVAGGGTDPTGADSEDFALVRLNGADGTLDTGFDGDSGTGNGKVHTDFLSGSVDASRGMALQPDGKILLTGFIVPAGGNTRAAIARYNADGTLDASFDGDSGTSNGRVTPPLPTDDGHFRAIAAGPGGKIIAAGTADVDPSAGSQFDFIVSRLLPSGALDDSFAGDGVRTDAVAPAGGEDRVNDLILDGGRILVAGYAVDPSLGREFALARYLPGDNPDTRFTRRPRRRTHDRTPTFAFRSDEPGSTFLCKLDRRRFRPCGSPKTLRRLRFGRHLFKVKARDEVGNLDPTPAKRRFRVLPR